MLSMRLKHKIADIRPEHKKKKNYFLVPKSAIHTGLNCIKNSATNISFLGPFKEEKKIIYRTHPRLKCT
jgi:hypothetical protein